MSERQLVGITSRRVTAAVVSADVSWHVLPDLLTGIGVKGGPILSILVESTHPSLGLELLVQSLIMISVFYHAVPSVFPAVVDDHSRSVRFRLFASVASFAMGVPLLLSLSHSESAFTSAIWTTGIFVVVTQGFGYYYQYTHEDGVFSDGPGTKVLAQLLNVEIRRMRRARVREATSSARASRIPSTWTIGEYLTVGAIAAASAVFCLFLGLFGAVGASSYPVLEVLLVGWMVGDQLKRPEVPGLWPARILQRIENVEEQVYRYVSLLSAGREGVYGLLTIAFGFTISVRVLRTALDHRMIEHGTAVIGRLQSLTLHGFPPESYLFPLVAFGWFVVPLFVSVYGLWFWYRLLRRLPYSIGLAEEWSDSQRKPVVRRPSLSLYGEWWFLFVAAQLTIVARFLQVLDGSDVFAPVSFGLQPVQLLYLLFACWPVYLASLVYRSYNHSSRRGRGGGHPDTGPNPDGAESPEIEEDELRLSAVLITIAGYAGLNALISIAGLGYGPNGAPLYARDGSAIEAVISIPPLSSGSWMTYLYVGLGMLLLSWALDNVSADGSDSDGRVINLSEETIEGGYHAPVVKELTWVYLAYASLVIVAVEVVFDTPLPLFVYVLYGVPTVLLIVVFVHAVYQFGWFVVDRGWTQSVASTK